MEFFLFILLCLAVSRLREYEARQATHRCDHTCRYMRPEPLHWPVPDRYPGQTVEEWDAELDRMYPDRVERRREHDMRRQHIADQPGAAEARRRCQEILQNSRRQLEADIRREKR